MTTSKKHPRPLRTLITLALLIVLGAGSLVAGTRWSDAELSPKLALDLEGGTQVILTPVTTDGSEVTEQDIAEAIRVIRQRVDASGVAEAEITSQGGSNIVVALPGSPDQETLDLVSTSAQMNFRPVLEYADTLSSLTEEQLAELGVDPEATTEDEVVVDDSEVVVEDEATDGATDEASEPATDEATDESTGGTGGSSGTPLVTEDGGSTEEPATEEPATEEPATEEAPAIDPDNPSDRARITDEVRAEFDALNCLDPASLTGGQNGDPDGVLVTCSGDGTAKYILGPVEIAGTQIDTASSGLRQLANGGTTNEWVVNIEFAGDGVQAFTDATTRLAGYYTSSLLGEDVPPNMFAMVLDGLVISSPTVETVIPDGRAEISGAFDRESSATLANQLNFGALPLDFVVQSQSEISATLGSEQLQKGLIAGLIGLILVVIYSLVQYRALGLVTVASLVLATVITYLVIALLSWVQGYRLSLPGVAGLIVAIGITADSFIVYFERIRDELRDGRTLQQAVDRGWSRARRTILASDTVSFLAAVVLYFLAVGGVRGFAFTLGLTTLVDLLVVVMFTHPLVALLAKTKFFASGHRLSGLDPRALGGAAPRYVGRGKVVPAGADGTRMTIAERRAAERRAAEATSTTTAAAVTTSADDATENGEKR
ncbi:protein translocase subunit SecD [Flavimobilis marinus]|uniref:Protein translocase subunit SecD n=1 Tax=Flavimobilis marinus TaxID=285351 RepID=A0A1I2FGR2_9MICO|nr:protein translocase subunit SecD [Flavimobilis marinus]GHG52107.1 protein translocase subunit SecD [Flavimobilis marinus]SFF04445.1 preprotein translocase subunit SecD [Flavimobilis marinus]